MNHQVTKNTKRLQRKVEKKNAIYRVLDTHELLFLKPLGDLVVYQIKMRLALDHFNIVVQEMERSVAFYRDVLGLTQTFQATLEGEWIEAVTGLAGTRALCVFLQLPGVDVRLELLQYLHPRGASFEENSIPNMHGLRHFAFETDDMGALIENLKAANVEFVSPPVTVPFPVGNRGTKRLCYFHDPDGVLLEIAAYSTRRQIE